MADERSRTEERNIERNNERVKAIDLALAQIEKQFGKGSIMRLGSKEAIVPIAVISTGAISIDYALGVGGVPRGRVVEIFGPESSGKTTLALQVIAQAQKTGGMAAFVDAEHALDAQYAQKLGVELENLLVSQPDNGEQALEIVEVLVRSNSCGGGYQGAGGGDGGDGGKSGNDRWGGRAEVLRLGPHRHPPHCEHQGRRPGHWRPHPRESREEQGGAAVPRGRVRCDVRRGHL